MHIEKSAIVLGSEIMLLVYYWYDALIGGAIYRSRWRCLGYRPLYQIWEESIESSLDFLCSRDIYDTQNYIEQFSLSGALDNYYTDVMTINLLGCLGFVVGDTSSRAQARGNSIDHHTV